MHKNVIIDSEYSHVNLDAIRSSNVNIHSNTQINTVPCSTNTIRGRLFEITIEFRCLTNNANPTMPYIKVGINQIKKFDISLNSD